MCRYYFLKIKVCKPFYKFWFSWVVLLVLIGFTTRRWFFVIIHRVGLRKFPCVRARAHLLEYFAVHTVVCWLLLNRDRRCGGSRGAVLTLASVLMVFMLMHCWKSLVRIWRCALDPLRQLFFLFFFNFLRRENLQINSWQFFSLLQLHTRVLIFEIWTKLTETNNKNSNNSNDNNDKLFVPMYYLHGAPTATWKDFATSTGSS